MRTSTSPNAATSPINAAKNQPTTKAKKEIILPKQVVDKIKSNATNEREALIGLRLAYAMYSRALFNKFALNEWFDVPWEVLRAIHGNYSTYTYTLEGVIEFNGSWHNPKGKKGYCQKARFILGGYHITDFAAIPTAAKEQQANSTIEQQATAVYKCLSLKIGSDILTEKTPFFRASLIIAKYLTATLTADWFMTNHKHLRTINDDEELPLCRWVQDENTKQWQLKEQKKTDNKGKEYTKKMTGAKYKELCAYHQMTPIRYNKKGYVVGVTDINQFTAEKLKDIQVSAFFVLNAIRTGEYVPHRNDGNTRLDSAFTAMPNILTKLILLNGQPLLCQDLSNSQWVILGRLILNSFEGKTYFANIDTTHFADIVKGFKLTQDVKDFAEHTGMGRVYDEFAAANKLTRDDAKEAFMFWGFAKNRTPHRFKEALTGTYPTVNAIIEKFKAVHGHKQLPILLQRIEAALYIDFILADCLNNRLEVLTKHDSIYFTVKSKKKAIEIMIKHLDKHLVNYHLKP